jgi:hypothetical protein
MASGDITVFDEAKEYMLDGDWASTDTIKLGLTTSTPTASDAVPAFGSGGTTNYTEVIPGGNYSAGGETLDTYTACVTETGGTMTFDDTGASVSWAQDASNPTNALYGVIYNETSSSYAIAFIDLDGPIDMSAGSLTITWNASGIFTIT